ncbi:hypothetical protein GGR55DRAFT_524605 [Xylaria sp. FL0064]|nr:hypothetical protein GGR55DRAFT_524605 [Xylaria sp. FL0064]
MSGVRNLRAMFEQKGDGVPDRGRSPGPGGIGTPSPSASPRPLSKVRTSFVAVEKDGRIGLRREPSEDSVSVSSRRKLSNDTDTTTPQLVSDRADVFSDKMPTNTLSSFKTNLSHEAIPESPSQDTPVRPTSPKKEAKTSPKTSPNIAPNANPDKVVDEEEPKTKMLSGDPTQSSAVRLGGTVFNEGISDALSATPTTTTTTKASNTTKPTPKAATPISTPKLTTRTSRSTLATKSINGREITKAASSMNLKSPNGVNGKPLNKAASSANLKKGTVTKTPASKPASINPASSNTGFVKPKPKSPTRPVKLPSSLTTHTASSAQKFGSGNTAPAPAPRQSLSRTSGNIQNLSANVTAHRSPSRNSVSTVGTTTSKTLKHKPSSVGRSRPSLGPPPKQETKEPHPPKRESQVDESFLARMMRPTQSSAKKTSDKAPVTPPRKQNAPPKKPDSKDVERNAKKVATKLQASSTQARTAKDSAKPVATKERPTAKEIAPAVAQAKTAEEAIESAKKSTDTAETPLVEGEEIAAAPTAKDITAIVAQKETAEEIIEAAKTSADTVVTAKDVAPIVAQEETAEEIIETAKTSADTAVAASAPSTEDAEATEAENVPEEEPQANVSDPVAPVPVVSEDPMKVEDIEDAIREAKEVEEPGEQALSTDSKEVEEQESFSQSNGSNGYLIKEPSGNAPETAKEPPMPEEKIADS